MLRRPFGRLAALAAACWRLRSILAAIATRDSPTPGFQPLTEEYMRLRCSAAVWAALLIALSIGDASAASPGRWFRPAGAATKQDAAAPAIGLPKRSAAPAPSRPNAAPELGPLSDLPGEGTSQVRVSPRWHEVDEVLARGRRLESERRWAEALSHYEDAIRVYPGSPSLLQRYAVARQYFDLNRRYADRSFCSQLAEMGFAGAIDAYSAILLKIQTFYVDEPNWRLLVDHGTFALHVALTESAFQKRHRISAQPGEIVDCIDRLKQLTAARTVENRHQAREAVAEAAAVVHQRLGLPHSAVVMEYLAGACNALDSYSGFLTPDQLQDVYGQIEGNFVGLGVELKAQDGLLTIVRVISGSPAEKAGLRAGEQILMVDRQDTRSLSADEAANLLQGPEGSSVVLTVSRPGEKPREVAAVRRRVEVPSIDLATMIDRDAGIAYLRLTCFQKTTCNDLDRALWKLHAEGMRQLIIDLRGNPGGLLTTSVEAADRFLDRGVIVATRGRSTQEDFTYVAHAEGTWRVPLVVLIDGNSASAAEIFAGAIADHQRGLVVGQRSYGKGSVQGIFTIDAISAGLRLTTAKFYSPKGRPYSNYGVEPHQVVQTSLKPVAANPAADAGLTQLTPTKGQGGPTDLSVENDPVLSAAVRSIRQGPDRWRSNASEQRPGAVAAALGAGG